MKLDIIGLEVSYGSTQVLKGLTLTVEEGLFYTVLGDSGSGKSTILKGISGLLPLTQGRIILNHRDLTKVPTDKREIAYVFQKPLLFPHLTVKRNIGFQLDLLKWTSEKMNHRIVEVATLLQIEDLLDRYPHALSGGQQQRVSIGRAIAAKPKIILMDEPFSSLDPKLRKEMGQWLKELQKSLKLTILFVTHDVNEALTLSDQLAFLEDGVIQQQDIPSRIYNNPQSISIGEFLGPCNWIKDGSFVRVTVPEGHLLLKRPHQLKLVKGNRYQVKAIVEVGRSCFITIDTDQGRLVIEEDEIMLKEGDYVDVACRPMPHHYVKIEKKF